MEADFGRALANVLVKCDLPDEIRAHVGSQLRDSRFGFAYRAYESGDLAAARVLLGQMVRDGRYGVRELAYLGLSTMPASAVRLIRSMKQRLSAHA